MKQTAFLLLDLGNSRIKWRHSPSGCSGVAHTSSELWQQCANLPAGAQILGCAVGAADLQQQIDQLFSQHWQVRPQWLQVTRQALGIVNHYPQLNEQGPDRWAAILGARQHFPQQNLLVISAGTAIVIDTLLANGDYLGGSIAPGLGLMKSALHQATARLPHASGTLQAFPQSTLDAIETGCVRAIIGSIEQALSAAIAHGHPIEQVIVFGGDAAYLQPLLNAKAIAVDNLVLDGLAALLTADAGTLHP
ncbi:type III pantothenate kinase [Deefgea piscis]|uniref:Type III pantothenate kinase n=1 Tax=Deefgea piscis TaxID=2739061 RepID=A0A6M8SNP0_9NEIS|nr:type III pantothenate kinase [Deefgea piscis]QKJ66805.1 type III pantothenate kinase [Deefgea piscis]